MALRRVFMVVAWVTPILMATGGRPAAMKYSKPAFAYQGDENFSRLIGVAFMAGWMRPNYNYGKYFFACLTHTTARFLQTESRLGSAPLVSMPFRGISDAFYMRGGAWMQLSRPLD